jgi:hypothetical protein
MNIRLLIQEIKKYKKADQMSVFYIDLKSAYNTVDRVKLFNIIRRKQILDMDECDFIENLYNSLYY